MHIQNTLSACFKAAACRIEMDWSLSESHFTGSVFCIHCNSAGEMNAFVFLMTQRKRKQLLMLNKNWLHLRRGAFYQQLFFFLALIITNAKTSAGRLFLPSCRSISQVSTSNSVNPEVTQTALSICATEATSSKRRDRSLFHTTLVNFHVLVLNMESGEVMQIIVTI